MIIVKNKNYLTIVKTTVKKTKNKIKLVKNWSSGKLILGNILVIENEIGKN